MTNSCVIRCFQDSTPDRSSPVAQMVRHRGATLRGRGPPSRPSSARSRRTSIPEAVRFDRPRTRVGRATRDRRRDVVESPRDGPARRPQGEPGSATRQARSQTRHDRPRCRPRPRPRLPQGRRRLEAPLRRQDAGRLGARRARQGPHGARTGRSRPRGGMGLLFGTRRRPFGDCHDPGRLQGVEPPVQRRRLHPGSPTSPRTPGSSVHHGFEVQGPRRRRPRRLPPHVCARLLARPPPPPRRPRPASASGTRWRSPSRGEKVLVSVNGTPAHRLRPDRPPSPSRKKDYEPEPWPAADEGLRRRPEPPRRSEHGGLLQRGERPAALIAANLGAPGDVHAGGRGQRAEGRGDRSRILGLVADLL